MCLTKAVNMKGRIDNMSKYIVRALDKDGKGYCEEIKTTDITGLVEIFSRKATGTEGYNTVQHRDYFMSTLVCIDIDKMEEDDE